ncbi:MAG: nucleotidyltransferase family protein [Clostridia bacterium]|nr:nucleotidyltransferase family protein [Clostridia bacterium]
MDKTRKVFVEWVKTAVNGQTVKSLPSDIDYLQLYNLCVTQSMTVAIFRAVGGIKEQLPPKFYTALKKSAERHLVLDVRQNYGDEEVLKTLEENGIKHIPLKGYELKKLYPSTDMRFTSDCDILVEIDNVKTFISTMEKIGLKLVRNDVHHVIMSFPESQTLYEFHKTLFVGRLEKYFGVGFEKATLKQGYSYRYEYSKEDFYLTVLAHSAYHFGHSAGVGIRHLTDLYLMIKNYNLDQNYLSLELEKCALKDFNKEFIKLVDYWFNNAIPDDFTIKLADTVLESTVLENSKKKPETDVASMAKTQDEATKTSKIRTIFRVLFPKKDFMQVAFPFLKKAGWLTPIFYPVRWIKVIFLRPKSIKKLKKISNSNDQTVKEIQNIREKLGLENV